MKNRIIHTSCLLILASIAIGQTTALSTIMYISEVPFIVKTGIYSDKLATGGQLTTLNGTLQIALAPRNSAIPSDRYVKLGTPLPIEDYSKIQYSFTDTMHPNPHWLPIRLVNSLRTRHNLRLYYGQFWRFPVVIFDNVEKFWSGN